MSGLFQGRVLALEQQDYAEAQRRYGQALALFGTLPPSALAAGVWHQLGRVAEAQQQWAEAERCYRASLALDEQWGNATDAAIRIKLSRLMAWEVPFWHHTTAPPAQMQKGTPMPQYLSNNA